MSVSAMGPSGPMRATGSEARTPTTMAEAMKMPGRTRGPRSQTAATARPSAGQTGVAAEPPTNRGSRTSSARRK